MILIRPPAKKAAGITVNTGNMQTHIKFGVFKLHELKSFLRKSLKGYIYKFLKLLLMGEKPWTLIIKGKLPEEIAGLFTESFEHGGSELIRILSIF